MKKSKKQIITGILAASLVMGSAMPVLAAEGWKQNTTGWWYEYDDGTYVVNAWKFINNEWYFFDQNGYMSRGWVLDNNTWYFCNADGAMQSGWVRVDGAVYYLNPVSDGTKGAMKTGEVVINGQTYHFDTTSGACLDSVASPMPQFYGNGQAVGATGSTGGSSGGGGGSSSGGGGGSSSGTSDGAELNQSIKQEIDAVVEEIQQTEGSAIKEVEPTSFTGSSSQSVKVVVDEAQKDTATIAGTAGVMEIVSGTAEAMIDNPDVVAIKYRGATFTFEGETADEVRADAKKLFADRLGQISGETLSYLQGKTYTANVKLADGSEMTYTVTFDFE